MIVDEMDLMMLEHEYGLNCLFLIVYKLLMKHRNIML